MSKNANFAVGDTVKMKSGGPEMTVRGFEKLDSNPVAPENPEAHVRAEWMAGDGKIQAHVFSRAMLEGVKVENEDKPQPGKAPVADPSSGTQRALARQDFPPSANDPRAIPGGIPQNKAAPAPDRLWNEDADKDEGPAPNEDKQGRQFNSPARHEGPGGGPGSNTR
jgi:uncharacterized protein YodC (DUF2158 family)